MTVIFLWRTFRIMNVFASHIKILNLIKERSIKRNINYLVGDIKSQRNKKFLQNYLMKKITCRAISRIESEKRFYK